MSLNRKGKNKLLKSKEVKDKMSLARKMYWEKGN